MFSGDAKPTIKTAKNRLIRDFGHGRNGSLFSGASSKPRRSLNRVNDALRSVLTRSPAALRLPRRSLTRAHGAAECFPYQKGFHHRYAMKMEMGDGDAVGDGDGKCGLGGLRENQSCRGRVGCWQLDLGACAAHGRLSCSAELFEKDREAAQPVKPEACGPRPWTSQEAERLRREGGEGRRPPSGRGA